MTIARTGMRLGIYFAVLVAIAGCASAPTQEMSDARLALGAAREAGAESHAPSNLDGAERLLARAENALEAGNYELARQDAIAVRERAITARNIAEAIGRAKETLKQAQAAGAPWRVASSLLAQAEAAARRRDAGAAIEFANASVRESRHAIER